MAMTTTSTISVREKGITPVIARRGAEHASGLGVHRWVIEQSIALRHWFPLPRQVSHDCS